MEFRASDNAPGLRLTLAFDSVAPGASRRPRLPGRRAIEREAPHAAQEIARQKPERAADKVALQS
jgi:hypothetical protein